MSPLLTRGTRKTNVFRVGDEKRKLSLLDKRDEEQSDGGSWIIQKKSGSSGINATSSKLRGGVEDKKKTLPLG